MTIKGKAMKIHAKRAENKSFVAYYRVSTNGQTLSGLGLEAQQAAVSQFIKGKGRLIKEFTETESGKEDHRPILQEALAYAKSIGAILIIAKLDRLSRDVGFIFNLKKSGADIVACDLPDFNSLTLSVFAGMAQHERETISQRTKVALAAKKARGEKLGQPKGYTPIKAIKKAAVLKRERAMKDEKNLLARNAVEMFLKDGYSYKEIARRLAELNLPTPKGGKWSVSSVQRIIRIYNLKKDTPGEEDSDAE